MSEGPSRRRVLVVEDDPDIAFVARLILEAEGYAVAIAGTLGEARAALESRGPPDLAVLDLMLPDGNGLDLCEELKAAHPGLPVLVMSAYLRSGRVRPEQLRHCQADAVFAKPFDADAFAATTRALLRSA